MSRTVFFHNRTAVHLRLVFAALVALSTLLFLAPVSADNDPLWDITMVADYSGGLSNEAPLSLAVDAAGRPNVAYFNISGIRVMEWDGSTWVRSFAVTSCVDEEVDISLAVSDDGQSAAVSFYDSCVKKTRVSIGQHTDASWIWVVEDVPDYISSALADAAHDSAVAFDGNTLHVAFNDGSYVYYTYRFLGMQWSPQGSVEVDTLSGCSSVDIAVADGMPSISFDDGYGYVGYAWRSLDGTWSTQDVVGGSSGASATASTSVDPRDYPIARNSLAMAGDGQPRIAFYDIAARSLKYAARNAANAWTVTTVDGPAEGDPVGIAGPWPSLAFDATGNPHIGYGFFYGTTNKLSEARHAFWDGAAWQLESVDRSPSLKLTDLAIDATGAVHMAYKKSDGHNPIYYAHRDASATPPVGPDTVIDSGPPLFTNIGEATFTFHSDDPAATFECITWQTWEPCASPMSFYAGSNGTYSIFVRAISGGVADPSPAVYVWTHDTVSPDSYISSGPSSSSSSSEATFWFRAYAADNSPPVTFRCRVVPRVYVPGDVWPDFQPCASPKSFTGIDDGNWVFELLATDAAGNSESYNDGAFYYWTIDLPGPSTTITATPAALTNSMTAAFSFTSDDTAATFRCRLDSGDWMPCASPHSYTVGQGSHTFSVGASAGGEHDPLPASYTWEVDTTPPTTSLADKPPQYDPLATATFTFSSNDPAATFECQLDDGGYTACVSPQTYGSLSDGAHTFQVRAKDAVGNVDTTPAWQTWNVDTGEPTTALTETPPNPSPSPNAAFSFTGDDAGTGVASFDCSLDSSAWATCAGSKIYHGLSNGAHVFQARAKDKAGNVDATPAQYAWTVAAPPDTTITTKPTNPSNDATPDFAFTSTQGGSADGVLFHCQTDTNGWYPCGGDSITYYNLFDGDHIFYVKAEDPQGNIDPTPATWSWTMDLTPPETTITGKPLNPTNSLDAAFTFSSESGATFECKLDSGAYAACTSPKSYTGLADGSHTFSVRAIDAATNVDASPASYTWTIDTTPPDTTIATKPPNPSNSTAASFTFSSESGATFECKLDSGAYATCTSPKSYTGLADGSHTFSVRAIDAATNVDASPAGYTWTIDTAAPETALSQTPPNPSTSSDATFAFSSENGATFECKLDSGAYAACTSPKSYTGLTDGSHTFSVRAKDAATNVDASPAEYTWTIDTTPPDTTIATKPSNPSNSAAASFTFSSENGATFECKLDSSAYAACTSPKSYTGLTAGSHTFYVHAKDAAGNVETTPAEYAWTIDITPPETTLAGGPSGTTNNNDPSFTFSSEAGATFECRLDTGSWTTCASPKSYTDVADGSHTFEVRAKDAAGNTDASPATRTWTIDTTPPETTIDTWIGEVYTVDTITIDFSSNEVGSTFECQLDSSGWVGCASPQTYDGLSDGPHTFAVRATDAAGNADLSAAEAGWTVQTPGPETSLDSCPPDPSTRREATFTFSSPTATHFECALDEADFAACTSPHEVTGLADGFYFFAVRAVSDRGKVDESPAACFWQVDATSPAVTINQASGQNDPTGSSPIHFTALFSEPVNGFDGGDVTLSGTAGATTAVVTNLHDHMEYDVAVSGMTVSGAVIAGVAAGVAEDGAGNDNTAATSTDNSVTYDATAPGVTIDSAPPALTNNNDPSFTFSADESGSTFACRLDNGPWAACNSGAMSYTDVADGRHTFYVQATDALGNSGDPAGHIWTIDTAAPAVTIDQASGQPDPTDTGPIHFTVVFNEPVTDFATGDVTLSGTAGATTAVVTNLHDHMEYDVAVSGMTGGGMVIVTVIANVAEDAAGNDNAASTSTDNSVTYRPQPVEMLYITTTGAGGAAANPDGQLVRYTKGDILKWDGTAWTKWFSSANEGLPATTDVFAFDVADDEAGSLWLALRGAQTRVPGLGRVAANEIIYFDGQNFSRFFDGADVGLKTSGERINGLEVLPGPLSPIGVGCQYYLLISTVAGGGVPGANGQTIRFTGEDVLGFCMTSVGANTAGLWHLVFEGQAHGLQKNNSRGLSADESGTTLYFTAKIAFGAIPPGAIFAWDGTRFSGPLWRPTDHGITRPVDSIDVVALAAP